MTISINSIQNNADYLKSLRENQGKTTDKQSTYSQYLNDFLNISQAGSQAYNGVQTAQFFPTSNYEPTNSTSLMIDQKKLFLTNLQSKLNANEDSSSNVPEKLAEARATVKNDLSGIDLSSAADDQIDSLFTQVTQTLDSARPRKGDYPFLSTNLGTDLSTGTDSLTSTGTSLSVDDMKAFLTNLIANLTVDTSTDDNTSFSALNTDLADQLSGFDVSTATDDQTQSLFNQIIEALNNYNNQDSQQTDTIDGFPPILQGSGASLPPFNWRPTTEEDA